MKVVKYLEVLRILRGLGLCYRQNSFMFSLNYILLSFCQHFIILGRKEGVKLVVIFLILQIRKQILSKVTYIVTDKVEFELRPNILISFCSFTLGHCHNQLKLLEPSSRNKLVLTTFGFFVLFFTSVGEKHVEKGVLLKYKFASILGFGKYLDLNSKERCLVKINVEISKF